MPEVIMLRRKALIALITVAAVLFIGIIASFQYANYVDRRSNQKLCRIITLSDEAYIALPPASATGKELAAAFHELRNDPNYRCK